MHVETRNLTDEELATAVAAYTVAPRDWISRLASYSMYGIVAPMAGAKLIAHLLRFLGVPEAFAFPPGLIIAFTASLLLFSSGRRSERREQEAREAAVQSLRASGHLQTHELTVQRVWRIADYDHDSNWLIQVEPARFVYLSGWSDHVWPIDAFRRHVTIRLAQPVGLILGVSMEGAEVPTEPQVLEAEIESDSRGPAELVLLSEDELPAPWRQVVAPVR